MVVVGLDVAIFDVVVVLGAVFLDFNDLTFSCNHSLSILDFTVFRSVQDA